MFCSSLSRKRVFITRHSGLLAGHVGLFSVGIHRQLKKGSRFGSGPGLAEQAPLYVEKLFGIQRYSSLPSDEGKNPRRSISSRSFRNPPLRRLMPGRFQVNITMVFRDKKAPSPAIDGLARTLGSRGRTTYYLADGLMRINASVCKERNIGAEESPVIWLTPDLQIYGNQEIYISVNPDIRESRNEYATT